LLVRRGDAYRGTGGKGLEGGLQPPHKLARAGDWMGLIFSVPSGITAARQRGGGGGTDAGTQMVRLIVMSSPYSVLHAARRCRCS